MNRRKLKKLVDYAYDREKIGFHVKRFRQIEGIKDKEVGTVHKTIPGLALKNRQTISKLHMLQTGNVHGNDPYPRMVYKRLTTEDKNAQEKWVGHRKTRIYRR